MLQSDGGPTMRSRLDGVDDLGGWERMLGCYAELQVRASEHVEELLAAGAPDRRLSRLPGLFERLVAGEHYHLSALVARVEEREAELDAFGLPMSIDHGDLHAGNVLAPGDRYVFFDWHEGAVTHPFFSMVVATRWLHHHHAVEAGSLEEARLHEAYLASWAEFGAMTSLRAALDLALRLGTLTRALGWLRVLDGLPPAARGEWAGHASGWLTEVATELERE